MPAASGCGRTPRRTRAPSLRQWQIERGAIGICCAKLGEAEVFADAGVADIRLPYPLNPLNAARVLALMDRTTLSFIVDHLAVARAWSDAMVRAGRRAEVLVKVDVGFHRCGIDPDPATALPFIREVAALPGLKLLGLLAHAGHAYHAASDDAHANHRGGRSGDAADACAGGARGGRGHRRAQRRRHAKRAVLAGTGRVDRVSRRQLRLFRSHAGGTRRRDDRPVCADGARDGRLESRGRTHHPRFGQQDAGRRRRARLPPARPATPPCSATSHGRPIPTTT